MALSHLANNGGGAMLEKDYPYATRDQSCRYQASKAVVKPKRAQGYYYITQTG